MKRHVLIVDDDESILEVLEARLSAADFTVSMATSGPNALKALEKNGMDVVVSDMKMPEMSGLELLARIRAKSMHMPVIFLTAYGTIPGAVDAVRAGAIDYLTKPFDGKDLVAKINQILANHHPVETVPSEEDDADFVWGQSEAMADLKSLIQKIASSNANVLILGESGVGKECVARLLHSMSLRKKQPYVVVDCGSTPPGILESELFGHVKGSFTHAIQDKKGLIEAAHQGTLFLDEVGNISPEMQSRLLRFLEERKIRQVGAIKEIPVDCRVLAATNADLKKDVEDGKFRQDLYYRLKVITLIIPPLRERKEDIPMLSTMFVDNYCRTNNLPPTRISPRTMEWLQSLNWPGNVRELKNAVQTGAILCRNNTIEPDDLQLDDPESITEQSDAPTNFSIEQSEKEAIIRALKQTKGVKKDAAELLGISRRSIQYKSKKYNLDSSQFKSS